HEVPVDWVEDGDSRVKIVPTAIADLRGVARLIVDRPPKRPPAQPSPSRPCSRRELGVLSGAPNRPAAPPDRAPLVAGIAARASRAARAARPDRAPQPLEPRRERLG